ncbi:MAG TPA: MMPL family transporter [Streptosporangiaceae bacterium]|nr:MMPL family transporter [Streptosporangiaceae bacterium]
MKDPSTLMRTPATGPPPRAGVRPPVVERIAGWSARHRAIALIGWLLLVAGAVVIGNSLGTRNLNSYDPGQAGQAERVLSRPGVIQRDAESVLIQTRNGQTVASDPQARQAIRQVTVALQRMPGVATDIQSPLAPGGTGLAAGGHGLISRDGRSALVTFEVAGNVNNADQIVTGAQRAVAAVQAAHPGLRVAEAGDATVNRAISNVVSEDFRRAEVTSVPVTLILLLVVFGALIAAGIPLLLAGTAVATAISLLAIPSRWLPIGQTTSSVVLLVGMAVGIDYSLFYLRREREERAAGASQAEALRTAAATSGRAIVVSGLTVMISLAGLFLTGIDVFTGIAIGTITVVGVAVIGSLTALPALLSLLGRWVDKGKIPFLGRRRTAARRSAFWNALTRRVVARPILWGGTAALALLALAAPAFSLRLADPGIHDLPTSIPVVRNLVAIQDAFPGGPQPAEVVVTGHDLTGQPVRHAVAALQGRAGMSGPLREPVTATLLDHGQVLLVSVPLAGDGTNQTSMNALATLRDHALPATLGQVSGVSYAVTGNTAGTHDFSAQLHSRAPIVFAFVLGLAFLLLMVTFRSIAIPLMSIVLNLLSVGAAYGLLTLIFQDGHLSSLLGFTPYGGIVTWLPLFLFVLLFGLSMDYHVFILSRIRELRQRGWPTRAAITGGIGSSAGVVTSAAVIMVAVFSIFATLSVIEFKMFGVALAAAVLIDATVVRGVLMPASMALLGERNWYLPRWLSWLPGKQKALPAIDGAGRKEAVGAATGG